MPGDSADRARLVVPGLLFVGLLFLFPLAQLMGASVVGPNGPTLTHYQRIFAEPAYLRVLLRTLFVSGAVTLVCLFLGYPLGFALASARGRTRTMLLVCVLMPFWTNLLVRAYGWMVTLGPEGPVNRALLAVGFLDAPAELVFNTTGVVIGMTQILLPYMVFPVTAVLVRLDPALVRAAQSLGASPFKTFWHVTLPLTLPGVLAGALLVFVLCLGFFVIPALLGGRRDVLIAQLIHYNLTTTLNWGFAAALSALLLASTLLVYTAVYRFFRLDLLWGPAR